MKFFVLGLFASCLLAAEAIVWDDTYNAGEECSKQHGLNHTTWIDLRNHPESLGQPEIQEFLVCFFKTIKLLTETGQWNKEQMKTFILPIVTTDELKSVIDLAIEKPTIKETVVEFWKTTIPIMGGYLDILQKKYILRKKQ